MVTATRSRRFRWWGIGAALLALLLVAVAVLAWQLAERYGPDLTRERVAALLSDALERPVQIDRVIFQPWLGRIGLAGVRVAAGPSWEAGAMLEAKRILATVGISSLWRREVVVSRLLVEDVDLVLAGGGDGPPAALPATIPERIAAGPVTVVIRVVELARARVRYRAEPVVVEVAGLGVRARLREGGLDLGARADRVQLTTGSVDETIEEISAEGHLRGDRLPLDRLELSWHGERLTVRGELTGLGAETRADLAIAGRVPLAPVAARAGSAWAVDGVARLDIRVRGALAQPQVEGRVAVPALVAGPLRARRVSARASWRQGQLTLSDVVAEALGGKISGSLALAPSALARTRVTVRADDVALDALDALLAPGTGVSLGLRGPLTLEGEAHGDPRRPGEARVTARLEAPRVQAPGEAGRLGPAAVSGEVALADGIIEITQARSRWAAASLDVTGRVQARGKRLALQTTVSGDLARLAGAWGVGGLSGAATVDAKIAGPWDAPTARGVAQAPDLAAAGARLQAVRLPFTVTPRTLRLDGATAALGQTAVRLDGTARWTEPGPLEAARWRQAISVDASLAAPRARVADLGPWLPADWPAAGDFTLVAQLAGTPASWQSTGHIEADRLEVRGQTLQQVRADFALTPDGVHVRPLAVRAWGAPIAGEASWKWQGTGAAGLDVGPIALAAVPGVPDGLALAGTARARVDVRLASDGLAGNATVTAQGVTAAGLSLGDGSGRAAMRDGLLTADLAFPTSRLSATARGRLREGQTLTVHVRGDDLDAGTLAARALPANVGEVGGRLSAVAELVVPYERPAQTEGTLRVEPLRLTWAGEEWVAQGPVLVRRRAAVTALERLQLQSGLGTFTAGGTVRDEGALELTARGRLPLSVLPAFRQEVRAASGVLEATVKLGGSIRQPEILGEGQISNGQLTLAAYPDTLREVRARFTMSPRAVRLAEATASLGGGQLTASGEMAIEAARPGAYRFTITARQVATAPIADLDATWDADLELVGVAARAQLRGEARLQRALYTRDISILRTVLAGGPAREGGAAAGPGLHLDLRVALQDNLVVRTTIARFRAGGTLTVAGTTSAPVVFGTVETREGQIVFRRQTFTLTAASARFVDPRRIDPILDVRGTAEIRGYDVTLHISGRAEDLEIRFASSPPLPEEDVLSLVAFGATREQIGRSGAGVVAGEVAGLLVQDLFGVQPGRAGVDVLEVDTDPEAGSRTVRLGKQLSPRTLVVFSQNIDNAEERRLRVEYQVFGPLRVAGEQDFHGGFGGDVLVRLRFR